MEQLAESTSLDPVLLRSIERGDALPSTAKLDRIASTLGLDAFALYAGRGVERSLVVLPRHAARGDFQFQDLTVLRRALERATALREVSAILGQSPTTFEPRAPGAEPAQDGYHWARRVRAALGNVAKPLDDLPRILAETFHVPVIAVPLATTGLMAAAVRSSASRSGAVVLNTNVRGGPAQGTNQAWLVDLQEVLEDDAIGLVVACFVPKNRFIDGDPLVEQQLAPARGAAGHPKLLAHHPRTGLAAQRARSPRDSWTCP